MADELFPCRAAAWLRNRSQKDSTKTTSAPRQPQQQQRAAACSSQQASRLNHSHAAPVNGNAALTLQAGMVS